MKDNYGKSVSLKCITCGDTSFEYNEDKTIIVCKRCSREYLGGYDAGYKDINIIITYGGSVARYSISNKVNFI